MSNGNQPKDLIDSQKIATGFVSKILERIYDAAEGGLREKWASRRNQQLVGLGQLVEEQTKSYRRIKNILYYNDPVDIDELYVPLSFSKEKYAYVNNRSSSGDTPEARILNELRKGKNWLFAPRRGRANRFLCVIHYWS